MMRLVITGALFGLVLGCMPVDGTETQGRPGMRLELKTITSITEDTDTKTLSLGFEGADPVAMKDGEAGLDIERDRSWLVSAAGRGAPVAVHPETGRVLPATVSLEVFWAHEGPNEDGHYVVFGPPRPGAMYLDQSIEGADALHDILQAAISSEQSVAFALRDAVWIEDVRPLDRETAMQFLGFAAQ